MLVAIGLLHRSIVFFTVFGHLRRLLEQNPHPYAWQFLVPEGYQQHFWASLIYLQQGPPVPHVVFGAVVKVLGVSAWTAWFLIGLQAGLSIATAWLLLRFLWRVTARLDVSFALAAVFLLSTDLLVMEYNAFGQTFYEDLTMLLILAGATAFERWYATRQPAWALAGGVLVGLLALTRATFSWFAVVPLTFLLAGLRPRDRNTWRALGLYCLGLLPHAAWCAKNWMVYGTATPVTSSWLGVDLAAGLAKRGLEQPFVASIVDHPEGYEEWVVRMLRERGLVYGHPPVFIEYVPPEIAEEDARIQQLLGGTNRYENTVGQRVLSDQYERAYWRFVRVYRWRTARAAKSSYANFWEPIRNDSTVSLAPLYVARRDVRSFDVWATLRDCALDPLGERQLAMQGTVASKSGTPVRFLTVPVLPDLMRVFNILMIHGLMPLVLLFGCLASPFRRRFLLPPAYLLLVAIYAYTALVTSLAAYGENMRSRLDVEPVIWIVSVWSVVLVVRAMRFVARPRQ